MADREIGVGVIGFGLGGRVFHTPFVNAVSGLRLAAILQRNGDEAAKAYPAADIVRSLDELLADRAIELVVVTTPNATHFELAKRALEAGKHVVVDKPFAPTSAEASELGRLAKSKGLLAIPFHNRRWDGDFLTVKKLIAGQAVGRLVTFESHFDRFRPVPRQGTWKEAENPANGILLDLGPHLIDQAMALFGLPDSITASVRSDRDETAIEDAFDITLSYPGANGKGMLVHCRTSYLACDKAPRFLLHGTSGSFCKYGVDPQEPALVGGATVPAQGSPEVWLQEAEAEWGRLTVASDPAAPERLVESQVKTEIGDYRGFYANVRDAILGVAPLAVTAEDGLRVIRLLELARQSSAAGCTLKVEL
ncbi:Gfo/Idh/MocA family oxidoreductase [Telmatospirillum sp.]|uniref:Gfo/Idh/MocA family oxidoreductase n=1 Tax=Telmatospirillum sp. TaxID=2079197 RepID=UPI00284F18BD|nr:Gfo/Idh/MocA family oxidoreductase [Telmatospirillum sp.]MDR3440171.1 Gfo/Idh/MocA family oxidoreductase [Telmatospirillum sp.]